MLKWGAAALLVAAIGVMLFWPTALDFSIAINPTTHRGFPMGPILFWVLLAAGAILAVFAMRARRG
ncbi:MAG TPA: hypothetical protein VMU71_04530 [Terracidiphilus sp.]|jgi:hypothetical protein|nr:hypothetical protein [Terracidiphilus sp.]